MYTDLREKLNLVETIEFCEEILQEVSTRLLNDGDVEERGKELLRIKREQQARELEEKLKEIEEGISFEDLFD